MFMDFICAVLWKWKYQLNHDLRLDCCCNDFINVKYKNK